MEEQLAGKLHIFFSYAPRAGQQAAMLRAACWAGRSGKDVLVGMCSTEDNPEVEAYLKKLPVLPPQASGELDLDGALARAPQLLVVEALEHTNAPGSRHVRRLQDVEELLHAGIDVYTTLDVRHLESLRDVIVSAAGIYMHDRIPDRIFDDADRVELVDADPAFLSDELGISEKSLSALREIALRRMADRINLRAETPAESTGSSEHILICISGAPSNARVIRAASRMADAFHGAFTALYVEPTDPKAVPEKDMKRIEANIRLAEELGARVTTVYGDDPAVQIAAYARTSGVTRIVMGRSVRRPAFPHRRTALVDRLSSLAPELDVYIIPDQAAVPDASRVPWTAQEHFSWRDLFKMLGILLACTIVGELFVCLNFNSSNIIMIYLLGVLCVSIVTQGRLYSLLASLLAVLVYNFVFTYPYFSFLSRPGHFATFGVMLLAALLSSSLTVKIKRQALQSARKAHRTEILLETNRVIQKSESADAIISVTATQLKKLLNHSILFYPATENGELLKPQIFPAGGEDVSVCLTPEEREVALWVQKNNKHAGATTNTLPSAHGLYLAVRGTGRVFGVAVVLIRGDERPDTFEKDLMVAILDECGLALERDFLRRDKQKVEETARQEALRANLLRAISHDLRTPLTSISGNAGILMENSSVLDEPKKKALYTSIYDDALWLIRLVENLLSVTRIENGTMKIKQQPELLEEVFQEAVQHLDRRAGEHSVKIDLQDDLLMADMDVRLIMQVVINMVNNAVKYTPAGSTIVLSARPVDDTVLVEISDDGPGVSPETGEKLFEMFYTADNDRGDGRRGLGLGLALCKSIVLAHGGTIGVRPNKPHGACFYFTLHLHFSEVDSCEQTADSDR